MGKTVAFLGILDSTHAPNQSIPQGYFVFLFTRFINQNILKSRFTSGHRMVHIAGEDEYRNRLLKIFTSHNYARMKYRTTPYPETIILFNTIGRKGRLAGKQWESEASGGLETIIIPGKHTGLGFGINESEDTFIREPHVEILTKKLNERLDNAS